MLFNVTNAIKLMLFNVLPQTDISDFFHLSLNLWNHIKHAVLQERYMSDAKFG